MFSKYFSIVEQNILFVYAEYAATCRELQLQHKLTNLKLSNFCCEHIQYDRFTSTIFILSTDQQLYLSAWVETSHSEEGVKTGDIGQSDVRHSINHLQHKHLLQSSIKARLTLHLDQLPGLRIKRVK